MPIYEHKCPKCQQIEERYFSRMIDYKDGKTVVKIHCPICGHVMNQLPSVSNFKFKGSGFYVNDYKKEGK